MGIRHPGAHGAPFLFEKVGVRVGTRLSARPGSRVGPGLALAALLLALPLGSPGQTLPAAGEDTLGFPLRPDTVFRLPSGPQVVLLDAPDSPVAALRLLVPLVEGPVEAGSASVLLRIRLDALRSLARQVGARVEAARTPRGIAYSVSGPLVDLDYLGWLIRQAVAEPGFDRAQIEEAVAAVRADLDRSAETAEGRLRERLQRAVWPSRTPPDGTPATLDRINEASLRDFWARTHQARRMTLVVVGHVEPVLIFATLQNMGAPEEGAGGPLEASAPAPGRLREVQILRTWYGQAFVVEDGADPRAEVAAALMAERLRRASTRLEGTVELWEAGEVSALTVVGAAYREDAEAMRRTIRELPGAAAVNLDEAVLQATVARVREDFLFEARTPWGLASTVGAFAAETGDPRGAEGYLSALDALTLEGMRSFLTELQARTPIREELRP